MGSDPLVKQPQFNGGTCNHDDECRSGNCCPWIKTSGRCRECCRELHCTAKTEQPSPGEFGLPLCVGNTCQAFQNKKSTSIRPDGYLTWIPSETMDNTRRFHEVKIPRHVEDDQPGKPLMEQLYYIDLNHQDDERFDASAVVANETHIRIPSVSFLHAGYSKSYHFGDQETGIVTFMMAQNDVSLITAYPEIAFTEKYHAMTFQGKKDTSRGDYVLERSEEGMKQKWSTSTWLQHAKTSFLASMLRDVPFAILESISDKAHSWQIRRWVNEYPSEDTGKINPTDTAGWAKHADRAKQAIELAKDPNWVRDLPKSHYECKHIEAAPGLEAGDDSITLPLGRPLKTFSGENQQSPQYFISVNSGHATAHYNPETNVLQLYLQFFGVSRSNVDVKFPGAHPNGVWLSPVAEGSDYGIDPTIDGRTDEYHRLKRPLDSTPQRLPFGWGPDVDFTLWQRPRSETCDQSTLEDPFWEAVNLDEWQSSSWNFLLQSKKFLDSTVHGITCGNHWNREDYGRGSKGFGPLEYATWLHMLTEVASKDTKFVTTNDVWDTWECFYQNKKMAVCTAD